MDPETHAASFNATRYMTKIKGADYLPVPARVAWFRHDSPRGTISTEVTHFTDKFAVIKAVIEDVDSEGQVVAIASAHGYCHKDDFAEYVGKAETKSVGRALAMLGYGTLFAAADFEETGEPPSAMADSPQRAQQYRQDVGVPPERQEQLNKVVDAVEEEFYAPPRKQVPVGFGDPPKDPANVASTAQIGLVNRLLKQKVVPMERDKAVAAFNHGDVEVNNISKQDASRLIDHLKTLPDL